MWGYIVWEGIRSTTTHLSMFKDRGRGAVHLPGEGGRGIYLASLSMRWWEGSVPPSIPGLQYCIHLSRKSWACGCASCTPKYKPLLSNDLLNNQLTVYRFEIYQRRTSEYFTYHLIKLFSAIVNERELRSRITLN